jgi:hypothetical protein
MVRRRRRRQQGVDAAAGEALRYKEPQHIQIFCTCDDIQHTHKECVSMYALFCNNKIACSR